MIFVTDDTEDMSDNDGSDISTPGFNDVLSWASAGAEPATRRPSLLTGDSRVFQSAEGLSIYVHV